MTTITIVRTTYRITGIVADFTPQGNPRIVLQDLADSTFRGMYFLAKAADGSYRLTGNNIGTSYDNPATVAHIDTVVNEYINELTHGQITTTASAIRVAHVASHVAQYGAENIIAWLNAHGSPKMVADLAATLGCTTDGAAIVAAVANLGKPAPEAPAIHPHRETTINRAIAGNVYITDPMVDGSETLRQVAINFVETYKGHSTFVQNLAVALVDFGRLSVPQMRGALNVMVREAKIEAAKPAADAFRVNLAQVPAQTPEPAPVAPFATITPVVPNGTYTVPINDAGEYRVIRVSTAEWATDKPAGTQWAEFQSGASNETDFTGCGFIFGTEFKPSFKMRNARDVIYAVTKLVSTGRHAEFGKLWAMESKRCFICGRKLTVPISKLAGIGPKCAENTGIDIDALAALNASVAGNVNDKAAQAKAQADIDELFPE